MDWLGFVQGLGDCLGFGGLVRVLSMCWGFDRDWFKGMDGNLGISCGCRDLLGSYKFFRSLGFG
jgi:hypothetical protein